MLTFPCVCCGHLTLGEPPGSYEICSVCFWEDDRVQLRWPKTTVCSCAGRIGLAERTGRR
ncbi:CPCC family cysteine-rich protein [Streptomyces sp. NPDC058206]